MLLISVYVHQLFEINDVTDGGHQLGSTTELTPLHLPEAYCAATTGTGARVGIGASPTATFCLPSAVPPGVPSFYGHAFQTLLTRPSDLQYADL